MTRAEYMDKLADCLKGMPEQERRDALNYYEEYFDAAGPEAEAQTIRELGSPETVAQKIRDAGAVPDEPRYGYNPEPRRGRLVAFWAGLSLPGRVLCVALSALAVVSVCFQLLSLFGTVLPLGGATYAASRLDQEYGDAVVEGTAQAQDTENRTQVAVVTETAAELADDADAAEDCWSMGLASFRELEVTTNAVSFAVMVERSMSEPTLAGDGVALGKISVTSREEKLIVKGPNQEDASAGMLILILPSEAYLEKLELTLNAGNADLPPLHLKELEVEANAGDVMMGTMQVEQKAELTVNAGSIEGTGLNAREAELKASAGGITLSTLECTEKAELETNAGSIEVNEMLPGQELDLECKAGNILLSVQGSAAEYHFKGASTMGSIFYDGDSYENAKVEKNADATMKIDAECDVGSIEISFLG